MTTTEACPVCDGDGTEYETLLDCPECGGSGTVRRKKCICADTANWKCPVHGDIGVQDGTQLCGGDPKWQSLYLELLVAVGRKFPNESRHETALRYILSAESQTHEAAKGATNE
jgi:hypothetical protein